MKKSDHLFLLIKSLSKSEKRFFRLSSSIHSGLKNHIVLFDAFEKLVNSKDGRRGYNEKQLRSALKGKKLLSNLSYEKNYLYRLILRCLNDFHRDSSVETELKNLVKSAEILYRKSLLDQSMRLIGKAKKEAIHFEKHEQLLEILTLERKLVSTGNRPEQLQDFIEVHYRTYEEILIKLRTQMECARLQNNAFILSLKTHQPHEPEILIKEIESGLKALSGRELSYDSRRLYLNTWILYSNWKGDASGHYHYAQELIHLLESHPHRIREQPLTYIVGLNNLLVSQLVLKKIGECLLTLKKLRTIPKTLSKITEELRTEIYGLVYPNTLDAYIRIGEFEQGLELVKEMQTELEKHETRFNQTYSMLMNLNISIIYFGLEKFNLALRWLNKILNAEGNAREDILCFARIYNLVVHYELKNFELMEYLVKSTYRYLYKRKRIYRFETEVLHFFRKFARLDSREDYIRAFRELRKVLEPLTTDVFEKGAFEHFNYLAWLDSKIENRPFKEMIRRAE